MICARNGENGRPGRSDQRDARRTSDLRLFLRQPVPSVARLCETDLGENHDRDRNSQLSVDAMFNMMETTMKGKTVSLDRSSEREFGEIARFFARSNQFRATSRISRRNSRLAEYTRTFTPMFADRRAYSTTVSPTVSPPGNLLHSYRVSITPILLLFNNRSLPPHIHGRHADVYHCSRTKIFHCCGSIISGCRVAFYNRIHLHCVSLHF